MCWVMPPASPATTLAWRMASSRDVLPWSTWPMMVTIGGRGTVAPSSSGRSNNPSSTSEFGDALDRMAHFLCDELRRVGVEHVGQRHHAALAHQELDHVDGALGHAAGELLDGDRLRQHDFARNLLFVVLRAEALEALRAATERGDRAGALLLGRRRVGDRQPAAVALFGAARGTRRGHENLLRDHGSEGGPSHDARLLFAGLAHDARSGRDARCGRFARDGRRRRRLAAGQTAARLFLGLALEIGFLRAAQLLLALARLGGLAFGPLTGFALATRLGLGLLTPAVLLLASPRVEQRPGARFALLGGEGRQDDARLGGRRRGRPRRSGRGWPPRGDGNGRLGGGSGRSGGGGRGLARSQNATLHLLDDDRLAAPVREALSNGALLNRALEVQG